MYMKVCLLPLIHYNVHCALETGADIEPDKLIP
jgi:hypothetical protein